MPKDIVVPELGLTAEEVTIARWLKQEGAQVSRGEPVVEVLTDKATIELEAGESGVLAHIAADAEQTVPVGAVIGVIALPGEDPAGVSGPRGEAARPVPAAQAATVATKAVPGKAKRIRATPVARRLAAENGIEIAEVRGTGAQGRVDRVDVEAVIAARPPAPSPAAVASPPSVTTDARPAAGARARRRLSDEQIRLAQHLAAAALVPQFSVARKIDVAAVNEHRRRAGGGLTVTDYFVKAAGLALRRYPTLNASLDGDEFVFPSSVNIAIAVAAGEELRVPVVRDVQDKTLEELAVERRGLVERARAATLTRADMVDATFTISNLGMFGIDDFTPLLSPPQAAIMGVGQAVQAGTQSLATVRLVCDHRVVNGATAALFLEALAGLLAWPGGLDERTSEVHP